MANTFIFDDDEPQPDNLGAPEPGSTDPEQPEEGEGNNRTFLIAAIILGAIVLLSLICMAVLAVVWLPGQNAMRAATQEANIAAFTQTAFVDQQTQEAALFTPTLPPTEEATPEPTETPVVVFATSTASPVPSSDPATATVQALQTQLAAAQETTTAQQAVTSGTPGAAVKSAGTPGTPEATGTSQLAKTGFADEVGLPGLFILSIILVAVILLARRLRQAPLSH
jgi:cytoskeletal protein RodZ